MQLDLELREGCKSEPYKLGLHRHHLLCGVALALDNLANALA